MHMARQMFVLDLRLFGVAFSSADVTPVMAWFWEYVIILSDNIECHLAQSNAGGSSDGDGCDVPDKSCTSIML